MLKKLTLAFLSFLLVITISTAVIGLSVQVLLQPQVYEQSFEKHGAYTYIEGQISEEIPFEFKYGLKPTINRLLRNTLAYIRGDTAQHNLTIHLNGSVKDYFLAEMEDFPTCPAGQEPFVDGEVVCRPPDVEPGAFLDEMLAMQNESIPDISAIDLKQYLDEDDKVGEVRRGVQIFQVAVVAAIVISVLLAMMIILLKKSEPLKAAEVIDADLFAVSVSMIGVSFYMKRNFGSLLEQIVPMQLSFAHGIITDIVFAVLNTMMYYGAGLIAIGGIITAIAYIASVHHR